MPKSQFIDPNFIRAKGVIGFHDIQVNSYSKKVVDERESFSDEQFKKIFSDMATIREFESALSAIKSKGIYGDFSHTYPGPAHLSIGQEGGAVGQAFVLDMDDISFGSHRSHGELIAKSLKMIEICDDKTLMDIMQNYFDGEILHVVEKHNKSGAVKDLATDFLLYGLTAEVFARRTGFQRGMGGSMHAFFTPFGVYPNNAIVGGAHPLALGSALYKKINNKKGIVIANSGDGSLGCGVIFEAMNFATMDQIKELWDRNGGLPILFNFFNNGYGMGGQTRGETMAYDFLARIGAGITPNQMNAERIDGMNVLAVIDGMKRKKDILTSGGGACLLDVVTYRLEAHSQSDFGSYRTEEEIEAWRAHDPIASFAKELDENNIQSFAKTQDVKDDISQRMLKIFKLAGDECVSPYINLKDDKFFIQNMVFSNKRVQSFDPQRKAEVLTAYKDNARVKRIAKKHRYYKDQEGEVVPKADVYNIKDSLFEPIFEKFYSDPTMVAYGEEVRDWGGAFEVYNGITESIPYHRFFNSPISEGCIVGSSVGYAMNNGRVLIEIMYSDFIGRAGDEIFNQLAKWQAISAGNLVMPVVLRVPIGSKYGTQHSQDWSSLCSHIPGLKVAYPVTPYDCKGIMSSALNGTDPVVIFESQKLYDMGEMFHEDGVPCGNYEIEIGEPDIKRTGCDLTILSVGSTLYKVMQTADTLKEKYGIEVEVIDARSIVPFNYEKVIKSVKKTGKILLTSEACTRGSILSTFASNITEQCFEYLKKPPVIVGAENWIAPPSEFDESFFPQKEWLLDVINEKLIKLDGYNPIDSNRNKNKIEKSKKGV